MSVITIAELVRGAAGLHEERRRLEAWIERDLLGRFQGRILPVDIAVARAWGRIQAHSKGGPLPVLDCLIAATATVHELTVVTRNTPDIERCGAPTLNPWK